MSLETEYKDMVTSISESTRLWEKVLKKIEEKINEKKTFDTFFANSYIHDIRGNILIVVASNLVAKTVLSNQYADLIKSTLGDLTEDEYVVKIVTESEIEETSEVKVKVKQNVSEPTSAYFEGAVINPNLTFDNFVVGDFNKEAHQAALYVAKNGGNLFNPLFLSSHRQIALYGLQSRLRSVYHRPVLRRRCHRPRHCMFTGPRSAQSGVTIPRQRQT